MRILTIKQHNSMTVMDVDGGNLSDLAPGEYVLVPVAKDRCLAKVRDDEPIFVLRGQDLIAPVAIEYWAIKAKEHNVHPDKSTTAFGDARAMREYQMAHPDKAKYPD
jgi:hypothetical protein